MNAIGWRIRRGANSVRKIATPRESGTAIRSARAEESRVPKMSGRAPNCSATGSQVLVVTKWSPNLPIASRDPVYSS